MNNTLLLEILDSKRQVISGEIVNMIAPGTEGDLEILPGHTPLLSGLRIGEIYLCYENGEEEYIAVSGGFIEVTHNRILLLADTLERVKEIDIARAKAAKLRAEQRLFEENPQINRERAKHALIRAENRLKIALKNNKLLTD